MSEILITKKGEEVKVDEQKFIGENDETNEQWQGSQVQVESTPLIDPNAGTPTIIRNFMFAFNPEFLKKNKNLKGISKQELFNNHWKYLQIELWKDGLIHDEGIEPKITFKQKHYIIQIVCKPRLGVVVVDDTKAITDYLKPKKK